MDPYSLCPCGSGKKLKFCCNDLIGEIQKIHRMIEGDQPRAALRHVEQTLARHPGRASLLDLQAMLQFSLDELDAVQNTVEEFLRVDPQSATAHAHHAMLLTEQQKPLEAIDSLQTALERVDVALPQRVLEAIGAVGHGLLLTGDLVAARAHLWLYEAAADDDDHQALELLMRMGQMLDVPLLLRDRMALRGLPESHPASSENKVIQQLAASGRWRMAAAQCDELLPDHLDQPLLIYNRALLSGFLGDRRNFAAGMRLYARQQVPIDEAAEAEALAQLTDDSSQDLKVQSHRVLFDIADEDVLVERLLSNERVVSQDVSSSDVYERAGGPPPRGQYLLLDRDVPTDLENLTREQVPWVVGIVVHFGRQTDRAELLELVVEENDPQPAIEALTAVVGETLGPVVRQEPVGPAETVDKSIDINWYFPPQTSAAKQQELLAQERHVAVLERWPTMPRQVLGGKSPRDVADDPELRLPLLGMLLLLEQGRYSAQLADELATLRSRLGLPPQEVIPAEQVDAATVPLLRVPHIELAGLTNEQVVKLYQRSMVANAVGPLTNLVPELLRRPELEEQLSFDRLYEQLLLLESRFGESLQVIEDARKWSESKGQSCGRWDLLELQYHISNNNSDGAERMLHHLRRHHMDEPEVATELVRLLQMLGVMPSETGAAHSARPPEMSAPPDEAPAIWTPGAESESAGKSKLWTPD